MGDVRFRHAYARIERASERERAVRSMATEDLVMALAATSLPRDPLLVNVLATELQNRVRRTTAAVESIAEGVMIVDASQVITYANPTAARLLGQPAHEIVGTLAPECGVVDASGRDVPWSTRPVRRSLELGETVSTRNSMLQRPDGSRFPVSIIAAPIVAEGDIVGAVVAFRDITDEKRAEAELQLHRHLLDAISEAVVATGTDGRITYWNAAAERLYGWRADEVLGRPIVDVTPAEASREDAGAILRALQEGRSWQGVFPVRGREGPPFLAHVTNAPVLDAQGQLVAIIGISRPVDPSFPHPPPPEADVTPK